jgi:hypothetical protein
MALKECVVGNISFPIINIFGNILFFKVCLQLSLKSTPASSNSSGILFGTKQ